MPSYSQRFFSLTLATCLLLDAWPAHAFSLPIFKNNSTAPHFKSQALVAKLRVSRRDGGDAQAAKIVRSYPLPQPTSLYALNLQSVSPAPGAAVFGRSETNPFDSNLYSLKMDEEVRALVTSLFAERRLSTKIEQLSYTLPYLDEDQTPLLMECLFWAADQPHLVQLFAHIFQQFPEKEFGSRDRMIQIIAQEDESGQSLYVFLEMLSRMSASDLARIEQVFSMDSESPAYFHPFVKLAQWRLQLEEQKGSLGLDRRERFERQNQIYRQMALLYRKHPQREVRELAEIFEHSAQLSSDMLSMLRHRSFTLTDTVVNVEKNLEATLAWLKKLRQHPMEYVYHSPLYIDLADLYADYLSYINLEKSDRYRKLANDQRQSVRLTRRIMREQLRISLSGTDWVAKIWLQGTNALTTPNAARSLSGFARYLSEAAWEDLMILQFEPRTIRLLLKLQELAVLKDPAMIWDVARGHGVETRSRLQVLSNAVVRLTKANASHNLTVISPEVKVRSVETFNKAIQNKSVFRLLKQGIPWKLENLQARAKKLEELGSIEQMRDLMEPGIDFSYEELRSLLIFLYERQGFWTPNNLQRVKNAKPERDDIPLEQIVPGMKVLHRVNQLPYTVVSKDDRSRPGTVLIHVVLEEALVPIHPFAREFKIPVSQDMPFTTLIPRKRTSKTLVLPLTEDLFRERYAFKHPDAPMLPFEFKEWPLGVQLEAGWYAAIKEAGLIRTLLFQPRDFADLHGRISLSQIAGITLIYVGMSLGVLAPIGLYVFSSGSPWESVALAAMIALVFPGYWLGNVLSHGIYNTLAILLGQAPLILGSGWFSMVPYRRGGNFSSTIWTTEQDFSYGRRLTGRWETITAVSGSLLTIGLFLNIAPALILGYYGALGALFVGPFALYFYGLPELDDRLEILINRRGFSLWTDPREPKPLNAREVVDHFVPLMMRGVAPYPVILIPVRIAHEVLLIQRGWPSSGAKWMAIMQTQYWRFKHRRLSPLEYRDAAIHIIQKSMGSNSTSADFESMRWPGEMDPPQGPPRYVHMLRRAA